MIKIKVINLNETRISWPVPICYVL